jgi:hypothetical protein
MATTDPLFLLLQQDASLENKNHKLRYAVPNIDDCRGSEDSGQIWNRLSQHTQCLGV